MDSIPAPPAIPEGALDSLEKPRLTMSQIERILLFLALPVVVPSLIINFLMAKRWGRVDFVILGFDGLVLLFLSMGSPFFFIMLCALFASGILCILRAPKLPYGIFLGYSNAVAMLLIGGGILWLIGFFGFVPWKEINYHMAVSGSRRDVTARQVTDNRVSAPRKIRVTDGGLEWTKKVYRLQKPAGIVFTSSTPGKGSVLYNPSELWEKRDELAGSTVTLEGAILSPDTHETTHNEIMRKSGGVKEIDLTSRTFAYVKDTEGRVWVAAQKADALNGTHFTGTAVIAYSDASRGRWYSARFHQNLPYMGMALFLDHSEVPAEPGVKVLDTWLPIKDTGESLWACYPGDLEALPPPPLEGVLEGHTTDTGALLTYIQKLSGHDFRGNSIQVLNCTRSTDYRKAHNPMGKALGAINWFYLLFLLPGLALTGWAFFLE
jgi:hypothetical protein